LSQQTITTQNNQLPPIETIDFPTIVVSKLFMPGTARQIVVQNLVIGPCCHARNTPVSENVAARLPAPLPCVAGVAKGTEWAEISVFTFK